MKTRGGQSERGSRLRRDKRQDLDELINRRTPEQTGASYFVKNEPLELVRLPCFIFIVTASHGSGKSRNESTGPAPSGNPADFRPINPSLDRDGGGGETRAVHRASVLDSDIAHAIIVVEMRHLESRVRGRERDGWNIAVAGSG